MEFKIENGKVKYKEKNQVKTPAIMVKLEGQRLSNLQRILIASGYEQNPSLSDAARVSHQRAAIIRLTERLLDFVIEEHLPR